MKYISIIGSTGSIGTQTLDIVRSNKDLKVTALAAGTSIDLLEKQARERKRVIRAYKTLSNNKKVEELAQRLRERNIKHVILYYYSYATDLLINYADQLGIVIDYIVEDVKEPRRIPRLPYNTVNYPNCDAIINCNIRYPKLSKRKLEERTNNLIINAEDILDLRECL